MSATHKKTGRPVKTARKEESTNPIKNKDDVQQSNDEHIDQDFPGFPHHPSKKNVISNGSAGAFASTEETRDEEDSDEDNDDLVLNRRGK